MFGKNETLHREYYWTDTATKISAIRIELIDQPSYVNIIQDSGISACISKVHSVHHTTNIRLQ